MNDMLTKNRKLNLFSQSAKYIWACSGLVMLLLMSASAWAQTAGASCDAPLVVNALPFTTSGSTSTYGNNYGSTDVPAVAPGAITNGTGSTSYISGNEVVFAYTPTSDHMINVSTTNDDDWIGLWAFTGCPFASTVGYHTETSGESRAINELPVLAGTTYYFVIATWTLPASTDFTISIEEAVADCPDLGLNIGDTCDDGDPNTIYDVVTEECKCEGTLPPNGMVCEAPIEIASLPYTTTDNTENYFDNYGSSDRPALADGAIGSPSSSYLNGDDVVYAYTPGENQIIDISVTEHGTDAGVFVFTGCPFESTVGGHTSSSGTLALTVVNLPVEAGVTYYVVISTFASPQTTPYTLNITQFTDCEGTPSAGTPDDDALLACAGAAFNVSVSGATDPSGGLEGIWQSSPAGENNWTDIDGATSQSYYVSEGIEEATDYRYTITCNLSGESDESDVIQVSINTVILECYCIPTTTNNNTFIDGFTATGDSGQDIENTESGASLDGNGYSDYTNLPALKANATSEVDFTVVINSGQTAGVRIWVDWNQDGQFDTSDEVAYSSGGYLETQIGSFIIPDTASGNYRLRVGASYIPSSGPADPCELSSSGEYEDYILEVIALDNCTEAVAGTPDVGALEVCADVAFTVSVSGASEAANGLVRIWQSSPAGQNDWTDIDGANSSSYSVSAGIEVATDFQYVVTCSYSATTAISNVIQVSLSPGNECYCEVSFPSSIEPITYVGFGNIDNISDATIDESPALEDFTNLTASVNQGGTYPIDIQGNTDGGYASRIVVYVDWNQDGVFDNSVGSDEMYNLPDIVNSDGEDGIKSEGFIEVPEFALLGNTRMRVMKKFSSIPGPCNSAGFGQAEDYTIIVSEGTVGAALNGSVDWNSSCDERDATVKLYEPGTDSEVASYDVSIQSDGSFNIPELEIGTFDVIVKVEGFLAKGTQDVEIAAGNNSLAVGAIVFGDFNTDNIIGFEDVALGSVAFGTVSGELKYNSLTDYNCDGIINFEDVAAFSPSFSFEGATAPLAP